MDTHFAYLNILFRSFVEDGNDIAVEEDIFSALSFNGGIAGTTTKLINAKNLVSPRISNNKKFACSAKTRSTHDI